MKIYTIGHSNRPLDEFIAILTKYKIEAVADIRRFPTSKRFPWYKRENLEIVLKKNGIKYFWLGDLLGGYRKGGYAQYMITEDYKKGIEEIIRISGNIN